MHLFLRQERIESDAWKCWRKPFASMLQQMFSAEELGTSCPSPQGLKQSVRKKYLDVDRMAVAFGISFS